MYVTSANFPVFFAVIKKPVTHCFICNGIHLSFLLPSSLFLSRGEIFFHQSPNRILEPRINKFYREWHKILINKKNHKTEQTVQFSVKTLSRYFFKGKKIVRNVNMRGR